MASIDLHPSSLAYAMSYARVTALIGWGSDPFLPNEADGDPANWLIDGEERLLADGLLTGRPETGLNFTEDLTQAILALVNPGVVLMAQRRAGSGVRTMTVHAAGDRLIGLIRRTDGMFEMTRYAELTAAAGACAVFVGASLEPLGDEARVETDQETLSGLKTMARNGDTERAAAALVKLGAAVPDAAAAIGTLAAPAAAGVLSVLYCAANTVQDTETFSVLTGADDQTWIVFAPAGPAGPTILERSSTAALTARVAVGIAARLNAPG